MKMKTYTKSTLLGALILAFLAGPAVDAQQKIEDQDLLNLLEQVDQKSPAPSSDETQAVDPLLAAVISADTAVETAVEGDEISAAEAAEDAEAAGVPAPGPALAWALLPGPVPSVLCDMPVA